MKEIKFRAWDGNEKHFVFFELFQGVNNHSPAIYNWARLEPWQQFTGLKDKNGKEIYEGDIVEFLDRNGEKKRTPCEWLNGGFTFHSFHGVDTSLMEVIGSIYENLELLKL